MALFEAYGWRVNEDGSKDISIDQFETRRDAEAFTASLDLPNKLVAEGQKEISEARTLIWGGR